ncbi:MAG: CoA transferase, partial [Nitrospinae bacterium]|nr:CoA transferase [Nitrospinota bacterium]
LMTRSGEEWIELFEAAGVPSAPVNPLDRALDNEQVEARRLIREYEYPEVGTVKIVGNPILNRTENGNPDPEPAPLHGGDTEAILRDLLHYKDEQIHTLIHSRVVIAVGSEVSKK